MQTTEKLAALRLRMRETGADGYVVVTDDYHGSEYVGGFFKTRAWLSGFTGSAGTLVVLPERAALWTDGRYFLQAARQLAGSTIELMRDGQPGVPGVAAFLAEHLPQGATLGFDGRTVSAAFARTLTDALSTKRIRFLYNRDLAGDIWPDRPALSAEPVWELDAALAGLTREEKLRLLRQKMDGQGADMLLLTALDEIAWTLNLRGDDVACTPVFLSFLLIEKERATLCVQRQSFSPEIEAKLAACGVTLTPYESIYALLTQLPDGMTLLADGASANYCILRSIPAGVTLLDRPSPAILLKAVKTEAEQTNIRAAHVKDGVAVCRFLYWLKTRVGRQEITERSAAARLEAFRAEQADYLSASFAPIAAYGPHAAIVHYDPAEQAEDTPLAPHSLCLFDTGGHYLQGTTDITRTVALGPVTEEERRLFTLVLRGHLRLSQAQFPQGAVGQDLDILARQPLWEQGLDFLHGTGHGVGYLLSVHEGPQRLHWRFTPGGTPPCALQAGMVISNEPGYYQAGAFGIRHENLLLVRPARETEYGAFLRFENLTMVPFDRDAIDPALLTENERGTLNRYHQTVWETVAPYLGGEELAWLRTATAPL